MFIKNTSEYWHEKFMKKYSMRILDPDGWDRKNFYNSWYTEKITWKEFLKRCFKSTTLPIEQQKDIVTFNGKNLFR